MVGALQDAGDDDGRGFGAHDMAGVLVGGGRNAQISSYLGGRRHQVAPGGDAVGGIIGDLGASLQHEAERIGLLRRVGGCSLLNNDDSYFGFSTVGGLFETGPAGTNVNDFRAFLIT